MTNCASTPEKTTDRAALMQLLFGSRATEIVSVMARMELADAIGDNISDYSELAHTYNVPPDSLNRLLRALTSLGVCTENKPGKFSLTNVGALLKKTHPATMRDFALFHTSPITLEPWTRLEDNIRTGRNAFNEHFGVPIYQYFARDTNLTAQFNSAMSQESRTTAETIAEHYDFSKINTVTDIGGGDGTLMKAILNRYPAIEGTIFETPEGAVQASDALKNAGIAQRCNVITGDFFDAIPGGSDLYIMMRTIHNWDDERALTILRNCQTAMSEKSRLLLVDVVLPDIVGDDNSDLNPYIKDLQMLVLVGGKERTRTELEQLCEQASLKISSVTSLASHIGLSLTEVVPV